MRKNSLRFRIVLDDPVEIHQPGIHRDDMGRAYVSSVSLKRAIRQSLTELVAAGKVEPDSTDTLFGVVSTDAFKPSSFTISAVLTMDEALSSRYGESLPSSQVQSGRESSVASTGPVFKGEMQMRVPPDTPEDMALRLALLSVRDIGLQGATCKVEIEDENIKTEVLYEMDVSKEPVSSGLNSARIWIPDLETQLIAYLAKKPAEMRFMTARAFEELVATLFRKAGFDVQLTPATRDGGYDILAVRHDKFTGNEVCLIECKRYNEKRRVGIDVIRSLMGVIQLRNATKGVVCTTAFFSPEAQRTAATNSARLVLHDYDSLRQWLRDVL